MTGFAGMFIIALLFWAAIWRLVKWVVDKFER